MGETDMSEGKARSGGPRRWRAGIAATTIVAAVAATGCGWVAVRQAATAAPAAQQQQQPQQQTVPVQAATAARGDVPVYLTGLGTVQAYNTVTVRSRVDGELQKVAFTEGQEVKAGDVLAQIDPRPFQAALDQAVAKKAQDQANLENAKVDLQRYAELATRNFATKQQTDTQRAMVAQLTAQIQGDQAAIDNARTQLGYTTITSPIDGRTGIRLVDQGNIVHATDAGGLVVITQLQPISAIFTLPEAQLAAVRAAQQAAGKGSSGVSVVAQSRDGKTQLAEGALALVDNQIDQSTGTIRLKATFPNKDEALWPGQFINVRLLARIEHGAVTVPAAAVQRGPDGLYAYVVAPDGTAQKRAIDVGQIAEGKAVIAKGVEAGERVVTAGQYRVQEGARLDVRDGGGGAAAGNSTGSGDRGGDETAAAAGAGSSSK